MAPNKFIEQPQVKRAGRACLSCRARKIRCNFEQCGSPCSNCLNDDVECLTTKSRRGKKPYRRLQKYPKGSDEQYGTGQDMSVNESLHIGRQPAAPFNQVSPTHTAGWLDENVREDVLVRHNDAVPKEFGAILNHNFLHQELSYASLVDKRNVHPLAPTELTPRSLSIAAPSSLSSNIFGSSHINLPDFIRPLSLSLTEDAINYLRLKGALDVPTLDFIKSLLFAYVRFVYPMSPILDLSCCCGILEGKHACISILQIQAIAFASVPFVDLSDILKAGFSSRRSCRKAFYNKTRLLYDFDVETDKLTIVQAVLLLAYWNEKPGDNKGAYYWTGIAIGLAQTLGLHRKGEYKSQLHETKLLKRLWWSCYVRDRMLGLAMGRPLRIQDTELDTPPLTLQDFDIMSTSDESSGMIPSADDQIALAEIFISMVEVWNMGGKVLSLHFSVLQAECNTSTATGDNGSSATMLFLKSTPSDPALVKSYDDQLQVFHNALPASCSNPSSVDQKITSSGVSANAGYLHIVFWSVVSALHRPQLRSWGKALSLKRVEEAAIEVSKVDQKLYELGRDRYLSATAAIPFQITAFMIHTKRLHHKKTDDVAEVLESLFFCVKVIEKGRESFPGGDDSVDFLRFIAFTGNVTLLFDSQSKLWGVEYGGVHVSPGSRQVSRESPHLPKEFGDTLPESVSTDSTFTGHLETSATMEVADSIDPKAFSFDDVDAVNWDSLADFLPGCSVDYDFSTPMVNMTFT